MRENMMKEDIMSSDVEIDEIGDTKMGEAKGTMDFPRSAANVAKKIMRQQQFKGLPKQWKGRGDYFFEAQDDGSLKITGGDSAKSLTGGKSTTITDRMKIKEILDKARGGDVIEENVTYKSKSKSSDMSQEEMDTIPQRTTIDSSDYQAGEGIKSFGESDAVAGMEERLGASGMGRDEGSNARSSMMEKGEGKIKEPMSMMGRDEGSNARSSMMEENEGSIQESSMGMDEGSRLGESEADEFVIALREMGYSDEMIEGIPERLRDQFLRLARRSRR